MATKKETELRKESEFRRGVAAGLRGASFYIAPDRQWRYDEHVQHAEHAAAVALAELEAYLESRKK